MVIWMPVLPDLSEIALRRRNLRLTQTQLAKLAGVSQSAVAKIERGQMMPSYDMARRIFDTLQGQMEKAEPEKTASKVRTRIVHSVSPDTTLQMAAEVMRHHGFSQLPVLKDGRNVGLLTEGTVGNLILEGKTLKEFATMRVSEVMEAPLPTIDDGAPVSIVAALLQRYPAVLVVRSGEVAGIIAKSDLMKLL